MATVARGWGGCGDTGRCPRCRALAPGGSATVRWRMRIGSRAQSARPGAVHMRIQCTGSRGARSLPPSLVGARRWSVPWRRPAAAAVLRGGARSVDGEHELEVKTGTVLYRTRFQSMQQVSGLAALGAKRIFRERGPRFLSQTGTYKRTGPGCIGADQARFFLASSDRDETPRRSAANSAATHQHKSATSPEAHAGEAAPAWL